MTFEAEIQKICDEVLKILKAREGIRFSPMRRRNNYVNTKHGYVIGRTNLKTGHISIDIFTPKFRKPKKISSILRTLCHEAAHHQKMPFRQRYRGRWIIRQHYPAFYKQVAKNIEKIKKNKELGTYFTP